MRDTDGQIRALSNVCLHRNTVMVDGPGNALGPGLGAGLGAAVAGPA